MNFYYGDGSNYSNAGQAMRDRERQDEANRRDWKKSLKL